jgi:hypothetical protein
VKSKTTAGFWRLFELLPFDEQDRARQTYQLWQDNPNHPSLHFKKVSRREPVYSVRIGLRFRSLGLRDGDVVTWYWIGTHAEYDKLLK